MKRAHGPKDANRHAVWAIGQAIWPLAILAGLDFYVLDASIASLLKKVVLTIAIASTAVTVAYSAILAFDALLFRIIASYEDEWKGGAAVDDLLARMHLKRRPEITRPLADRAAGTRRLAVRQRLAFAVAAAATLALAF